MQGWRCNRHKLFSTCPVVVPIIQDVGSLEGVQRKIMKRIKGLENLPCKERLKELGLSSLEKARGNIVFVSQYFSAYRAVIKRMEGLSSQRVTWRRQEATGTGCTRTCFILI